KWISKKCGENGTIPTVNVRKKKCKNAFIGL
ncbi:hypothetical protein AZ044_002920, partial [Pluralibacter gergoviae]